MRTSARLGLLGTLCLVATSLAGCYANANRDPLTAEQKRNQLRLFGLGANVASNYESNPRTRANMRVVGRTANAAARDEAIAGSGTTVNVYANAGNPNDIVSRGPTWYRTRGNGMFYLIDGNWYHGSQVLTKGDGSLVLRE